MPRLKNISSHAISAGFESQGGLIAVLGPTNTGKTYFAIERLLAHRSGMIGLPLRLLAREVYDKLVARIGPREVALVTGEEKLIPANARYWVSTVEAMPLERRVEFLAIDEIQLAADAERGRVFTSRLLHARGEKETVFLGSHTMKPLLRTLFPDIEFQSRDRFSTLSYAGVKKVTRLPRRSAIVGFSADTVYAIAELVRRQRGGAAVVLGALSPRTRNAQAELYQSGEVDYLIATDAIGMGLNMDIDHVAFSARRKFDGRRVRDLRADEMAQIAGRAGRHIKDGYFGATADCRDLDEETIEAIENHTFSPVEALQWRTDTLDFSSIHSLRLSLDRPPPSDLLRRARPDDDETSFARLCALQEIRERATAPARVNLLWEVCQIPDFRKLAFDQHTNLLAEVFEQLADTGLIAESWLAPKVDHLDRIDGDIDAISTRIAHIRSWTYLANRGGWVENSAYWRDRTRAVEDRLSDALHEKLTQRFVDRRTAVLLRKLRDDAPLLAGVSENGEVTVEGQFVGRLLGFEFIIDPSAKGPEAKKVRYAADRALRPTLAARAAALANADADELELKNDGVIWWRSAPIAQLVKGPNPFRPSIKVRGLDAISPALQGRVVDRMTDYLANRVEALLGDLVMLKQVVDQDDAGELAGVTRGVAFRLVENFGAMSRAPIGADLKQLDQDQRAKLRKLGVRFGEYTLYMPALLKPAPARLLIMLWAIWTDREPIGFEPPKAGLVSLEVNKDLPHAYYYASGYRPSGDRAVRIDMLERLASQIRTARNEAKHKEGFEVTPQMMSLVGCSGEDFESILRSLGYKKQTIKVTPAPVDQQPADDPVKLSKQQEGAEQEQSSSTSPTPPSSGVSASDGQDEPQGVSSDVAGRKETSSPDQTLQTPAESLVETPAVIAAQTEAADETSPAEKTNSQKDPVRSDSTGQDDDAGKTADKSDAVEEIEIAVWRMAPRRQHAPDNRKRKDGAGGAKQDRNKRPKGGPKGRKDNNKGPRQPRTYVAGPKRNKGPDPDSPFAALAALKGDQTSGDQS